MAACHRTGASIEVGDRRAPDDSTSLRIACTPTAESLPFYYAVRSGICDSIGLPLRVKTYFAQFDADTALLGRTVDGGVTDQYRAAYYRSRGKMRDFDNFLSLDGRWSLVAGGRLRIRELHNLKGRTVGMARFANSDHYISRLRDSLRLKSDDLFYAQSTVTEFVCSCCRMSKSTALCFPSLTPRAPWPKAMCACLRHDPPRCKCRSSSVSARCATNDTAIRHNFAKSLQSGCGRPQ